MEKKIENFSYDEGLFFQFWESIYELPHEERFRVLNLFADYPQLEKSAIYLFAAKRGLVKKGSAKEADYILEMEKHNLDKILNS